MKVYKPDTEQFKNTPTARFFQYFYPKLKSGEVDKAQFFDNMGVGITPANQMQFFTGFKNGQRSITLEHINAAWDHYRVSPNYLFGLSEDPQSMVAEPSQVYSSTVKKDIDKIRKALDELERKIENK